MLLTGQISAQNYADALQKVSNTEVESHGLDVDTYEDYVALLRATNDEYKEN